MVTQGFAHAMPEEYVLRCGKMDLVFAIKNRTVGLSAPDGIEGGFGQMRCSGTIAAPR